MRRAVIIQPRVLDDLRDIATFYRSRANNEHVRAWLDGLMTAIERLAEDADPHPRVSQRASLASVRYKLYGKGRHRYRIVFQIRSNAVHVLFVRHGAQAPLTDLEIQRLTSDID